ncbi:hypothetical protein WISP_36928 [Willisornis vidua]|uniref:Uncharacterized protein n=1 Tax=Willisornis vidua TaxID=1566151 RepID=A0ABQ9DL72_9PASS|nr:hypothetical protein WISP_36928 [Willisornis vidua]
MPDPPPETQQIRKSGQELAVEQTVVVESPALEVFKKHMDMAPEDMAYTVNLQVSLRISTPLRIFLTDHRIIKWFGLDGT